MKYMQPKTFTKETNAFFQARKTMFKHGDTAQLNALHMNITTTVALTLTKKGYVNLTALQDNILDAITFYEKYNPKVNSTLVPFEEQMCEQHLNEFTQEEDIDGQIY